MTEFQNVFTDKEIEEKWAELEDVTTYFDEENIERLESAWWLWEKDTDVVNDIWYWFNLAHSKGLGWLYENI